MVELRTRYLGLDLRSPLVASASPLTGSLEGLRRLEAAGAAAVVLPSLFEEQLSMEAHQIARLLQGGADSLSAALALDDYNAGPFGYLALVEQAKATLQVPVIASLNGVSPGAWLEHATLLEEAGADALELNVYYVSSSPGLGGSEVEWRYLELVRAVRQAIGIPLAVKLSPYFSSVANLTRQLVEAGLRDWLERRGMPSVDLLRGLRSQRSVRDPTAWERANYITMLASYPDQVHTEAR
jgi:dihydroorotate dehydrogenase (fumarate)